MGPSRANLPYLAVAASIKLLMAIPESIWTAVERGKLLQVRTIFPLLYRIECSAACKGKLLQIYKLF